VYVASFSNQVCVYGELPNVQALESPTALRAVATSTTSVSLSWTSPSTSETGFAIERKEGFLGFASIATAPHGASSFVDTTVSPFGAYAYRVRALGAPAPSAYSNLACVTANTGKAAPRLEVSGLGHAIASGSPVASWTTDTDFGGSAVGASVSKSFALTNVGNAALHFTLPVTVDGANAADFSVTSPPPAMLAPGSTAPLQVAFSPAGDRRSVANLHIASDDPDQAQYSFAVGGIATGGLVGWWKLDDGSGTGATDASGEQNTGIATAVTWVAGHTNGAASFDGTTSNISIPDNVGLNPEALTIAAWINPIDWGGNRRVLQKGAFDDQYRLLVENKAFKFDIDGIGTVTANPPPTGTWTHVAGTYDGSTMVLYVNGSQVASTPASGELSIGPDVLCIGSKPIGPPSAPAPAAGDHFHGAIDEVRVYGRALSAAEIGMIAK
jgi:hypothetical protein